MAGLARNVDAGEESAEMAGGDDSEGGEEFEGQAVGGEGGSFSGAEMDGGDGHDQQAGKAAEDEVEEIGRAHV